MVDIIKPYNIYVDGAKVATATGFDSTIDAPGEVAITAEGPSARTQGHPTSKISLNTITTYGGKATTQKLLQALLNYTPLKITYGPVDGKIREFYPMWCTSEKLSNEFQSGKCTGAYDFEGGKPKLTG